MTETLNRPARPVPRPPRRTAEAPAPRPVGPGAAAALWAAVAGLLCVVVPVLLVWGTDSRSGVGWWEAVRSAGRFWLAAHGVPLDVPGGRFALTPMGLLLVPLALVARFAGAAARDVRPPTVRAAASLALWTAGPYAVLAALVALVVTGPDVHVSPVPSVLAGLLVGAAGAAVGVLRHARLWRAAWAASSARAQRLAAGAATAIGVLLGAGALLVGIALAVHLDRAADLAAAGDPGPVGGAALVLAGLALLPNAVVWGASWLAGPGFAVGAGTSVAPFAHELGAVPAFPLLAALPGGGVPGWVGALALVVPLGAGAVAGHVVLARLGEASWQRTALEAAAVGPVCGAAVGLLAWLSGGPVGGERLAETGPAPLAVALAVAVATGLAAPAAALLRRRSRAA